MKKIYKKVKNYFVHKYRHKRCDSNNRQREEIYLPTGSDHYVIPENFTLLRKKMVTQSNNLKKKN